VNILLLLALAAGVAYGWLALPLLLPLVSDDVEAAVEESEWQRLSEADKIRLRMSSLKVGMDSDEVRRVLDLADKIPYAMSRSSNHSTCVYEIRPNHTLFLRDILDEGLLDAELHDGKQVVARMSAPKTPSAKKTPGK
jgi:hypothetical protein